MREDVAKALPCPSVTMKVDFAGCYERKPQMAERGLFFTRSGFSIVRRDDRLSPRPNEYYVVGSDLIWRELLSGNAPEFNRFRTVGFKKIANNSVVSLPEAIEAARNYIGACAADKARELDLYCQTIGGHTSIATITPVEGFKWVDPPA
jgi:hypothetical protein